MRRFFSEIVEVSQGRITLSDKDTVHHIRDVLRLQKNDGLIVFDKTGHEYIGEIEKLSERHIILRVKEKKGGRLQKTFSLTFACAIPKNSRMDDIIDKLTQLGVDRMIPCKTKHTVVAFDRQKAIARHERWNKIGRSASEQSKRNTVPVIDPVKDFRELICEAKNFDLKLIPTLRGRRVRLKDALRAKPPKNMLVVIGPEGDFSEEEVRLARAAGFIPVSLGERVLRVETAAVAVASYIKLST
ncbi:MAG: RsmE family RNA methyltransferase [Candidatus Omnitrophota bacterium]